jgi:hypothetical protein
MGDIKKARRPRFRGLLVTGAVGHPTARSGSFFDLFAAEGASGDDLICDGLAAVIAYAARVFVVMRAGHRAGSFVLGGPRGSKPVLVHSPPCSTDTPW